TARPSLWLELCRVGRAVVALGLLVPSGPVSALAVRRTRLLSGPVRPGLVPGWHCGAGSGHAVVHHSHRQGSVHPDHYLSERLPDHAEPAATRLAYHLHSWSDRLRRRFHFRGAGDL